MIHLLSDTLPAILQDRRPRLTPHNLKGLWMGKQIIQALSEEARTARDQIAGLAVSNDGYQTTSAGGDDGCATSQGFGCREAKALMVRGHDRYVGGAIEHGQFGLGPRSQEMHAVRDLQFRGQRAQVFYIGVIRNLATDAQ